MKFREFLYGAYAIRNRSFAPESPDVIFLKKKTIAAATHKAAMLEKFGKK